MVATRKTKPFAVYLLFLKTGRLKTWRKLTKTKPFLRLRTSVGYEYPTFGRQGQNHITQGFYKTKYLPHPCRRVLSAKQRFACLVHFRE